MNNRSSFAAVLIICFGLSIYVFTSPSVATPNLAPAAQQQQESGFAYATLTINGATHVFDQGGQPLPREFTLTTLIRSLDSRERPSLVNLLNAIGNQGWELVLQDRNGSRWVFKRAL